MANFEVKSDALHFGEGSSKHILSFETLPGGENALGVTMPGEKIPVLHKMTEKGPVAIDVKSAIGRNKLDAILTAAEKGDLHPDTRNFLETHADVFKHGLNTDAGHIDAKKITRIDKLKKAIGFAKEAKAMPLADESELKALRAGLLEHGELGERLMDKEVMKAAGIMGLEKGEITRLRAEAKKLQELMKKPVGNERLINELLTRNHTDAPALLGSVEQNLVTEFNRLHGTDLMEHVTALDSAIVAEADKLKGILNVETFRTLEEELAIAKKGTDKAARVEAERAKNAALKEVREITKTPEGKAAYQMILKDKDFAEQLGEVRKASSELASHLDGTAKAAAKAVESGKGGWFTKSAEEIAKIAEKDGKAIEKVGYWARRTTGGKATLVVAGIGAGYGLYSLVAGTGNNRDQVLANTNRGRENEPAAGRA